MATTDERFWSHVDKDGPTVRPELGPCWVWTAALRGGYGKFSITKRVSAAAHRFAWFIAHGRWPEPCALHKCDNRRCVRPEHLFEGTVGDNNRDTFLKGRHPVPRGVGNGSAKLTEAIVRECRARYAAGSASTAELAQEFGVIENSMRKAINGETWSHVS